MPSVGPYVGAFSHERGTSVGIYTKMSKQAVERLKVDGVALTLLDPREVS